jgi:predicted DNA-binding transcriptional regulator AlpA
MINKVKEIRRHLNMLNQNQEKNGQLLTLKETAEFLRVSPKTLYVYTCNSGAAGGQKRNKFPKDIYIKLGRKVLFIQAKLMAWIESGAQFI